MFIFVFVLLFKKDIYLELDLDIFNLLFDLFFKLFEFFDEIFFFLIDFIFILLRSNWD